jgi:hypothetical protein
MAESEELADAALAADVERATIEHKGKRYEVRSPTLEQQKRIDAACKDKKSGEVDKYRAAALTVIACTFDPDTGKPVFGRHHEERLMKQPSTPGSFIHKVSEALGGLGEAAEVEADFAGAPLSNSSTP